MSMPNAISVRHFNFFPNIFNKSVEVKNKRFQTKDICFGFSHGFLGFEWVPDFSDCVC